MNHYQISIYWSVEDEAFIAEAPELPGCLADGPTRRKALANVEVIIQEWIETAQELGRPVPAPKGRLLTVAQAAQQLGVGVAIVQRYCVSGRLLAQKLGRDWLIHEADLETFRRQPRKRGRPTAQSVMLAGA